MFQKIFQNRNLYTIIEQLKEKAFSFDMSVSSTITVNCVKCNGMLHIYIYIYIYIYYILRDTYSCIKRKKWYFRNNTEIATTILFMTRIILRREYHPSPNVGIKWHSIRYLRMQLQRAVVRTNYVQCSSNFSCSNSLLF